MRAWLQRLLRAESAHLRAAVTVIILDDSIKPLRPIVPKPGRFDHVKFRMYADEEVLDASHSGPHPNYILLQELLPQLVNVRRINMRRPADKFPLDAVHIPNAGKLFGSARLGRGKEALKTMFASSGDSAQARVNAAVGVPDMPAQQPNLWQLLFDPMTRPHLEELFITGLSSGSAGMPSPNLLCRLTTLALHDIDCRAPGTAPGETAWTPVLTACTPTLRNLCLVRVLGFAALVAFHPEQLDQRIAARISHFPALKSFQAYKLVIRGPDSQALALFFELHSPTLEALAIGVRCDLGNALQPAAHFIRTSWLTDAHVLAKLRILRVENADFLRRWTSPPDGQPAFVTGERATRLRYEMALKLDEFVRARPELRDVSFYDLPEESHAALLRQEIESRPGGRCLIGDERAMKFAAAVPGKQPRDEEAYLWSAWVYYELLFRGLALENSGFRPFMPKRVSSPPDNGS